MTEQSKPNYLQITSFYLSVLVLILGLFAMLSLHPEYARSFYSLHYTGDEIPALLFLVLLMFIPTLTVVSLNINPKINRKMSIFLTFSILAVTLILTFVLLSYIADDPYGQSFPRASLPGLGWFVGREDIVGILPSVFNVFFPILIISSIIPIIYRAFFRNGRFFIYFFLASILLTSFVFLNIYYG